MLLLFITLVACAPTDPGTLPLSDATCDALFGQPGDSTGLTSDQCAPDILTVDGQTWSPPSWDDSTLAELRAYQLDNPPALLGIDPYTESSIPTPSSTAVCAATFTGNTYQLDTYETLEDALDGGAVVTHGGACGACSSLTDLAVYAGTPDLTTPVRACGLAGLGGDNDAVASCLSDIGFTPACAEIWAYNTAHTRDVCLDVCIAALNDPYHLPDGNPNACIQCDEDLSGPVFKAVAGRTRRNSGLATALCRPCETVWRIDHSYP